MFKFLVHCLNAIAAILPMLHRSGCTLLVLAALSVAPVWSAEPGPDVRVVVDISGSMKKNDPGNLRVPAVKLLSNLLPSNSRAAIWTFGQYATELVPSQPVSPAWQQQTLLAADKIGSTSMFTNIGLALQRSTKDWQAPATGPRHVILLTDGVVDISKNATDNQVARDELLNQILPALKATGAKLHTIALSADADAALLQQLARETDGMFERANNADELNRIFLRLFEQAAPRDALPLFDNGFLVDGSIDEITVLVFRKTGATAASLLGPDGTSHSLDKHPSEWRWHSDARYDLITVAKPAAGQWQIQAEVDPDNRVLVVSKLGLHVAAVPTLALAGEKIHFDLTLTEDGVAITRADFLKLVEAKVSIKAPEPAPGYQREVVLADAGGGHFKADWEVPALDANYQLAVEANAPTFQRVRKFNLQAVATPVQAVVAVDEHGVATATFEVSPELFKPDSISLTGQLELPDASKQPQTLTGSALAWQAVMPGQANGRYRLHWRFDALTVAGRPIVMEAAALEWQVGEAAPAAPAEKPAHAAEPAHEEPATEHTAEAEPDAASHAEAPAEPEKGGTPWLIIGIAINLVLVGIGVAFWWVRRRHKQAASVIDSALADDEDAPA
ncbi:VWA domain-containing protein [Permianibacter sp. IMCC34836]|uniref:VWA domain-containing protein n=1 Tax=Permianibacter fluminis TaxID=2738515 RepID=UPI001554B5CB|nr:vWA domain-containing protein [Permianibacter fluminis]NQD38849.1 VWA domain-containing protein [Permianibacter fluminis]